MRIASQPRSGFTLIEIIIVVMITATLLGIVMPSVGATIASARLGGTARSFVGDLRRARLEALRRNVPVTVRAQSGGAYQIDSIGQRTLEGDVTFSSSSADSVRFATFGLSMTGTVTFVLSVGNDSVNVVVSAGGMSTIDGGQ